VLSYLILGATYAFAAAVQPGQFQAYLISQTIANGWRRTVPAAFAPILSDAPIVCLVLLVLTHVPSLFVHLLQVAGGLFLLYLASGAFRACRNDRRVITAQPAPAHQTVIKAALVNLLNPNPYLAWALVMGPLLLTAWRQSPANGIALVGAFYLTMVLVTAGIVMLFAAARSFGPRVARVLVGFSAVALGCFGIYQLWTGSTELLYRFHQAV
jgi:threonine/homoserine/homoserine lactone efflux protein